jgi:hypothetical protein
MVTATCGSLLIGTLPLREVRVTLTYQVKLQVPDDGDEDQDSYIWDVARDQHEWNGELVSFEVEDL